MKLFISIFLIITHLISTIDVSVDVHQCHGENLYSLYGLSIGTTCECNHVIDVKVKSCCKDRKIVVKAHKKETLMPGSNLIKDASVSVPCSATNVKFEIDNRRMSKRNVVLVIDKSPPKYQLPLFLLYRNLLI